MYLKLWTWIVVPKLFVKTQYDDNVGTGTLTGTGTDIEALTAFKSKVIRERWRTRTWSRTRTTTTTRTRTKTRLPTNSCSAALTPLLGRCTRTRTQHDADTEHGTRKRRTLNGERWTLNGTRITDYGLQFTASGLKFNSNTIATFWMLVHMQLLHILSAY